MRNYVFRCMRVDAEDMLIVIPADVEEFAWYLLEVTVKNVDDFEIMGTNLE